MAVNRDELHDRCAGAANASFWSLSIASAGLFPTSIGSMDTLRPRQQSSSDHEQVRERAGDEQPVGVLGDTAVAHLAEAEHALDRTDRMLDLRAHARLVAVGGLLFLAQRTMPVALVMGMVLGSGRGGRDRLALAVIGLVAPDPRLLAVKQVANDAPIGGVRRRHDHRVDELGTAVDTEVALNPEVPLVALFRLVHLRIALAALVLGRTRGVDDRRINDRAAGDLHALIGQMGVDLGEQRRAQVVVFQQVAELADRSLVRRRLAAQVDADEAPHRLDVVQRLLQCRIGQVVPVPQAVHAQHALEPDRRPPALARGIVRGDHADQPLPRHDAVHLLEEPLAPCHLAMAFESGSREGLLSHECSGRGRFRPRPSLCQSGRINQRFLKSAEGHLGVRSVMGKLASESHVRSRQCGDCGVNAPSCGREVMTR